jgi:hypothetical protein
VKLLLALLGCAWWWPVFAEDKPSAWQLDPQPALVPGRLGTWDDFAIGSVCVIRHAGKWLMVYEGMALSEEGRAQGLGVAESENGVLWKKRSENPIVAGDPSSPHFLSAPAMVQWRDGLWVLCRRQTSLLQAILGPEDTDLPDASLTLAHLNPDMSWFPLDGEHLFPAETCTPASSRPSFYADSSGKSLHLWWLGAHEEGQALYHSVSRDAKTWSKPNHQLASQIDSRRICCARVYESGDYYILVYVAQDGAHRNVVTRISSNARSWMAEGPPEFRLPAHERHLSPWMVFTQEGARLYFPEYHDNRGSILRTAFCPKAAYQRR